MVDYSVIQESEDSVFIRVPIRDLEYIETLWDVPIPQFKHKEKLYHVYAYSWDDKSITVRLCK